ncbi:Bug family tripartite tricarboxylate transporter substrate binding protein [Ottowia thiooxydans]|uniref:Tripartite-type tricarboxylate transporter receptor subunit TctC n=1 Tax=Ottowia thiooxydans TaxID=219182 RepID=A0ABV2Q7H7_9BURK
MKIRFALALSMTALIPLTAVAQAYPTKAITIVVPFPAGGTLDNLTRSIAQKLGENLKQPVLVDNKPGAGTTIGTEFVARAKPDGYTFGMVANSFTINPSLYDNLRYNTTEDFIPIAMLAYTPHVLVASPQVGITQLGELVESAKKSPGKISFASFGSGTSSHIAIEVFKSLAKIDVSHVPYKGQAPALNDLLGGHVNMMFANLPDVLPHIQSGKLRAIAIVNDVRTKTAPNIPTFKELGYASFQSNSWYGMIAPKSTPASVISKIDSELKSIVKSEEIQKRLAEQGLEVASMSSADFRKFIADEIKKSEKIVKASGATVN